MKQLAVAIVIFALLLAGLRLVRPARAATSAEPTIVQNVHWESEDRYREHSEVCDKEVIKQIEAQPTLKRLIAEKTHAQNGCIILNSSPPMQ